MRSDLVQQRMRLCDLVEEAIDFLNPHEVVTGFDSFGSRDPSILDLLNLALGVVTVKAPSKTALEDAMRSQDVQMAERLSFPWTTPSPPTHQRVVILANARPKYVMERWLESAYHLGLRLVVLGPQGWWLQEPGASKAVEKFIPLEIKKDDGFLQKLLDALSDDLAHISAITTFTDTCMAVVAEAAEILGLPTAPSTAIKTSTDKHKTRKALQRDAKLLRVNDLNDLKHQIRIRPEPLAYPVIAKPCFAWGSNGVHLASTVSELYLAVENHEQAYPGIDVMIESYESGPEFDANFVLRDGKVLFFEVVDNFPCTAELDGLSSEAKNFMETDMVWPSALPQSEQDLIGRTLHKQLLLLGFRTGVFHVEGRVRNSAVWYTIEDGVLDLYPRQRTAQHQQPEPEIFLLEINPRAPGWGVASGTLLKSGIDFTALHLLAACKDDEERFEALSQPFSGRESDSLHCVVVYINAGRKGVVKEMNVTEDLEKRRPDLTTHVCYSTWFFRPGMQVPASGARVGMVLVQSRISRWHVLAMAQALRREIHIEIS